MTSRGASVYGSYANTIPAAIEPAAEPAGAAAAPLTSSVPPPTVEEGPIELPIELAPNADPVEICERCKSATPSAAAGVAGLGGPEASVVCVAPR